MATFYDSKEDYNAGAGAFIYIWLACVSGRHPLLKIPVDLLHWTCPHEEKWLSKWSCGQSSHHMWFVSQRIWYVEELGTLLVCTKPRTSHHRSAGGERHGRGSTQSDLPWKHKRRASSMRRTLEQFKGFTGKTSERQDVVFLYGFFWACRYHLELNWIELNWVFDSVLYLCVTGQQWFLYFCVTGQQWFLYLCVAGQQWFLYLCVAGQQWFLYLCVAGQQWFLYLCVPGQQWFLYLCITGQQWFLYLCVAGQQWYQDRQKQEQQKAAEAKAKTATPAAAPAATKPGAPAAGRGGAAAGRGTTPAPAARGRGAAAPPARGGKWFAFTNTEHCLWLNGVRKNAEQLLFWLWIWLQFQVESFCKLFRCMSFSISPFLLSSVIFFVPHLLGSDFKLRPIHCKEMQVKDLS